MALNLSQGNMYEFITHTFNTVKGSCEFDCFYCYMKRWKTNRPPRFDENELSTDLGRGNFIFVGSSCDLFAPSIPDEWIVRTLRYCNQFENRYLFQSKNPSRMIAFSYHFPVETSYCTTLETNRYYAQYMGNAPKPEYRVFSFLDFVTIEPIMKFDLSQFSEMIRQINPKQVNIGADSQNKNLPEPNKGEILQLIDMISGFTKVVEKPNLKRLYRG
jgi:hypothetical protein